MCRQVAISQRNICSTIWRVYDYAERSRRNVPVVNELEARFRIVGNAGYCQLCRIRHSWHAAEHLSDAFDAAYGTDAPKAAAQFEKYRHRLRDETGGVGKVIRALRHLRSQHPGNERIAQALGYFRNNQHRMGYAEAKAQGLPIGSGVVEATCKTLVTERLKRSGMRWSVRGGQAILTLRAWLQSNRFDSGWAVLSDTYRSEVSAPENVVPLRRRTRIH